MLWHHAAYADHFHHGYSHAGSFSHAGGWLGHTIISAVIHGLIYGAIFRIMRNLTTNQALFFAAVGIALLGGVYLLWSMRR